MIEEKLFFNCPQFFPRHNLVCEVNNSYVVIRLIAHLLLHQLSQQNNSRITLTVLLSLKSVLGDFKYAFGWVIQQLLRVHQYCDKLG